MDTRLSLVWLGLLGVLESTDVFTTALDRARGAIESMPLSADALNRGGLVLYMALKLSLVAAAAAALLLAVRWLRHRRSGARALYVYVLSGVRIVTVAVALASLNNALLLKSLG